MAPEAIRQKFSEKSDVWSYGIVVWEIVAGQLPHRGVDRLELPLMIRNECVHNEILLFIAENNIIVLITQNFALFVVVTTPRSLLDARPFWLRL